MHRCADCGATLFEGADWCSQCFAPVAALVGASGPQITPYRAPFTAQNEPVWVPPIPVEAVAAAAKANEGRVARPLAGILVLGFLVQVGLHLYVNNTNLEVATYLRVGQLVILAFYAVVLAVVVRMHRTVAFAPLWSVGATGENAAIGAFKGVVTASVVMGLGSLATGRIEVAPSIKWDMGDATFMSVVIAFASLTVAAPIVEELLFRGLAAEAMRHRGQRVALLVSGVLFALWHMRFGLLDIGYYTVAGVLLGRTYWKRGLAASMATHAGFNGTLGVVALLFIIGPGSVLSADGVRVEAPGGWDEVEAAEGDAVLMAHGPSAAVFYVVREDLPVADLAVEAVAAAAEQGGISIPGVRVVPGTARVVEYPAGAGVRMELESDGHRGEFVLFIKGRVGWTVALEHGTTRTRDDFDEMLATLRLPPAP